MRRILALLAKRCRAGPAEREPGVDAHGSMGEHSQDCCILGREQQHVDAGDRLG